MQDNRDKSPMPLLRNRAKDGFMRWKCPHCGKLLSKKYVNGKTSRFCPYCGGEIQK